MSLNHLVVQTNPSDPRNPTPPLNIQVQSIITGDIDCTGDCQIDENLNVDGTTSLVSASVSENLNIAGNLVVDGKIYLASVTVSNIEVTGALTCDDDANIENLTVNNPIRCPPSTGLQFTGDISETSNTSSVTLNSRAGFFQVSNSSAINASSTFDFTLTNSYIGSSTIPIIQVYGFSGSPGAALTITNMVPSAGSIVITVTNTGTQPLSISTLVGFTFLLLN